MLKGIRISQGWRMMRAGFWIGFAMFASFACLLAPDASAFQSRSGELVVIKADEVINDDVYVAGETIVLEGVVNGDFVAFGSEITVKGTITGSLIAAGRKVTVLGSVTGNIRMAGAELSLGEKAQVGGDVVAAGAGLDLARGSVVGRDVVFAGALALLAGDVMRNASISGAGLAVKGHIGGNLSARVADSENAQRAPWRQRVADRSEIVLPPVEAGLVIDSGATIDGSLAYTQSKDIAFPPQTISGEVTRTDPPVYNYPEFKKTDWALGFVSSLLSLLLIGLILLLIFPGTLMGAAQKLREDPVASFLWGLLAIVALIPVTIVIFIFAILVAGLFALLGLWPMAAIAFALLLIANLILIFLVCFIAMFVAKIVVGIWVGRWICEGRYLPMLIGVPIVVIAIELLSWIPILGNVLAFVVFLFGLGALWMRKRIARNI